jgi:hypothetical protein
MMANRHPMRNAYLALLILLATSTSAAPPTTQPADLVPLKITRPLPVFCRRENTKLRNSPDIDVPPDPNRVPMRVPRGTANVALERPVTVSNPDAITVGTPDLVTDGIKEGTEGNWIETDGGLPRWVQIDLGETATLHAIALWHQCADERAYHDVIVQACDRPRFDRDVTTLFNNDADNSAKLGKGTDREYVETDNGKLIDAKGVRARYVRLHSHGSTSDDWNHLTEVEVYGTPGPLYERRRELKQNRHASVAALLAYLDSRRDPPTVTRDGDAITAIDARLDGPDDLDLLATIPTLHKLTLRPGGDWHEWRRGPKSLPTIRHLDARRNDFASDFLMTRALPAIESLRLSLAGPNRLNSLDALAKLNTLRALHVYPSRWETTDLARLRDVPNLKSLSFAGCADFDDKDVLPRLTGLTRLERLDLSDTPTGDARMFDLRSLTALRSLNLAGSWVTDVALSDLDHLPALESLDVTRTPVSPKAAKAFAARHPRVKVSFDESPRK